MPPDIPHLVDAKGRLLDKTVRPPSHGRRLISRRAKITEVGDDTHKFVFLESEFTEAVQATNIDPTDAERGVEKYGFGADTFRVGDVVVVDQIDEQWWIRQEWFQVGRLVGSASGSSSSSAALSSCRSRIWDVQPVTAEFLEVAGLQDLVITDRDDPPLQAVEPPGLSLQAGDIVSTHRANNAYWSILHKYCSVSSSSSSSGSSGFSPTTYGTPIWWMAAALGVEEAANNPCEDGDPVLNWLDQSATGHDYSQGVGANQPTWVDTVVNGYPVVRFDGSSDYMEPANAVTFGALTAFTGLWVFKTNNTSTLQYVHYYLDLGNDVGLVLRLNYLGYITFTVITDVGSVNVSTSDIDPSAGFVVVTATFAENGDIHLWVNDVLKASDTITTLSAGGGDTRYLGTVSPATGFFSGDKAEAVYYGAVLSPANRSAATQALMSQYAIT